MEPPFHDSPLGALRWIRQILDTIEEAPEEADFVRQLLEALGSVEDLSTGTAGNTGVEDGEDRTAAVLLREILTWLTIFAAQRGIRLQAAERRASAREAACQQVHQQLLKKNMTLREQTMVDELTGLFNRRYFERSLFYDIERFRRYKRPIGVVLFDADFFKKINDTYGHSVGDAALKHLAELARTTIRSADLVARYGGEEYVLLLPETGSEGAAIFAERLRRRVESTPLMTEQGSLQITISLGVFAIEGGFTGSAEDVMRIVDNALYAAKDAWRNCCVVV